MSRCKTRPDHPDQALERRLRLLQEYVGAKNQNDMAAQFGATKTAWNNVMRGRKLSRDLATDYKRWPEITLEWLLLGETDLLAVAFLLENTE